MALPFELLDCVTFWSKHRGDSLAVVANGRGYTYRELLTILNDLGASLEFAGFPRVALYARAKLATALGVLGSLRSGRSAVILNPQLPPETIKSCMDDAKPGAVLVAHEDHDSWKVVTNRYSSMSELPTFRFSTAQVGTRFLQGVRPEPAADTEWAVLYSSGSTGVPKGIERDFESMHTEFLGWCLELRLGPDSRFYIARPVFYTGGLVLTMATLLAGGTAILNEVAGAADALVDDIVTESRSHGPLDWAFLVPEQVRLVLNSNALARLRGHVRGVLTMGAPISGREKLALAAALECKVRESWGNSESLGTITDDEMLVECPDSIGRPFLGDSMSVVDDAEHECPVGAIGRLAGGELAGFTCYTARPNDTAATKRGGLIISEDLGWCDEKGRFFIAGRIQERILVNGQQVFLPQLEDELRGAGLTAAFCLTHRSAGGSAEVGLLFETGTTTDSNVGACLARVSVPVVKIANIAALPRTASGKIDRSGAARYLWPVT